MAPLRGPMLLALLCLLFLTKSSFSTPCQLLNWDESLGPNPVTSRRGNVVLAAMFHGYCYYCVQQARRLYELKNNLTRDGFTQIEMVIINGGMPRSSINIDNLINASPIPVIQDRPDNVMYRRMFRASKDDFIVYDRCGQLAFYLPHPYSNLNYNITERVLKAVHNGEHSCYCSLDYSRNRNTDDMMMGDDPGVSNANSHTAFLEENTSLNCRPNDLMCQFSQMLNNPRRLPFNQERFGRRSRYPTGRTGRRQRGRFLGGPPGRVADIGGFLEENDGLRARDSRRERAWGQRDGFRNANSNRRFNRRHGRFRGRP